jgi:hypothetical protein
MKVILSLWFPWRDRNRPPFVYPVPIPIRTVVFEPLFRRSVWNSYVDPQASDLTAQVGRFRPAALAGRLDTLLDIERELDRLPTHGVVVFTPAGGRCLSETDRDAVWDAYRVPVFEQVITAEGRLVAWECEAHDGLHLVDGARTASRDTVETDICHCGVRSARATNLVAAPTFTGSGRPPRFLPGQLGSAPRRMAM